MALFSENSGKPKNVKIETANSSDYCYSCASKVRAKDDADLRNQIRELTGKENGKPVIKLRRSGNETVICMACINEFANELNEQ
jgi:hypothetical protein